MTKKITIKSTQQKTLLLEKLEDMKIILEKDSHLTFVTLLKKGWDKTKKLDFTLKGKNSCLNFISIIIAKDSNNFEFETTSNHLAPHTKSFYQIRSVLYDKARINYKGTLIIAKKAQHTETHLSHDNLSFSKEAKIQTIPSLEIEADNVHAGHSATIGKIDKNQLFYMASRGINRKTSEKILTESFLKKDFDKITDQKIKQFINSHV
jgi:Fe-S cluster assembly protein SufD